MILSPTIKIVRAGILLLLTSGGVSAGPANNEWPADQCTEFTGQVASYFQQNKVRFKRIRDVVSTQKPDDLRAGREGMIIKWAKHSEWDPAPDDIGGLLEDFHALQLLSVKTKASTVFFLPRTPAIGFGPADILAVFLFAPSVGEDVEYCTDELLLENEQGWCWFSLGEQHWYVEMDWMHLKH